MVGWLVKVAAPAWPAQLGMQLFSCKGVLQCTECCAVV